jgi:hypothetical protein
MAITYTKIKETKEKWGIDVLTIFHDDATNEDTSVLFGFKNSADIVTNFNARMTAQIPALEAEKTRDKNEIEIIKDIDKYFETNNNMNKNKYEDIKKEKNQKINYSKGDVP